MTTKLRGTTRKTIKKLLRDVRDGIPLLPCDSFRDWRLRQSFGAIDQLEYRLREIWTERIGTDKKEGPNVHA
jgi:hypothetical protein